MPAHGRPNHRALDPLPGDSPSESNAGTATPNSPIDGPQLSLYGSARSGLGRRSLNEFLVRTDDPNTRAGAVPLQSRLTYFADAR